MSERKRPVPPIDFSDADIRPQDKYGAPRHGGRRHNGLDLYDEKGKSVRSSLDGTVQRASAAGEHEKYGALVIIDHTLYRRLGENPFLLPYLYTLYGHLDSVRVAVGQQVYKGDTVGTVGDTGNAKGMKPHVHFEVIRSPEALRWNTAGSTGVAAGFLRIDPVPFLNGLTLLPDGGGEREAEGWGVNGWRFPRLRG